MKTFDSVRCLVMALVFSVPSSAFAEPAEQEEAPPASVEQAATSAVSEARERGFGVVVGSAMNGEVLPVRLIAMGLYHYGAHQFELGGLLCPRGDLLLRSYYVFALPEEHL